MRKLLFICIMLNFLSNSLFSQNKAINGRVVDDNLETIPGVSIIINDTVEVGKTDLNGFFKINIPISIEKIFFKAVGLDPTAIEIMDNCVEVEVVMMLTGTFCFITPQKADRLRMKRFKKLPKFHKQAFEEGIFKTDKACYKQDFIIFFEKK
jgi:hypothetical protein